MARNGTAIDPVCGRTVREAAAESQEYQSRRYFFCSAACRRRFEAGTEQVRAAELARLGALFGKRATAWGMA